MKYYLSLCTALLMLALSTSLFAAEEGSSEKMTEEAAITTCEGKYTAETYPDEDERNKLIDQCVTDNTAAKASTE